MEQRLELLQLAERFAKALDADDFEGLRSLLAGNCLYDTGNESLRGVDVIIEQYRKNAESARRKFDRIDYSSWIEAEGADQAVVHFTDSVFWHGLEHAYHCQQRLRIENERIVEIRHEEMPGERESLENFLAKASAVESDQ